VVEPTRSGCWPIRKSHEFLCTLGLGYHKKMAIDLKSRLLVREGYHNGITLILIEINSYVKYQIYLSLTGSGSRFKVQVATQSKCGNHEGHPTLILFGSQFRVTKSQP
jgi:hypothetical protein